MILRYPLPADMLGGPERTILIDDESLRVEITCRVADPAALIALSSTVLRSTPHASASCSPVVLAALLAAAASPSRQANQGRPRLILLAS